MTDINLTDPVTTKLCTSINGKPIVSMAYMFDGSKTTNIDFSSFDTSNVLYMIKMFYKSKVNTLELSNFDMRKVEDASYMFCNVNTDIITKGRYFVELDNMYECKPNEVEEAP